MKVIASNFEYNYKVISKWHCHYVDIFGSCLHTLTSFHRFIYNIIIIRFNISVKFNSVSVGLHLIQHNPWNNSQERREWLSSAITVGSLPHVQYITDSENLTLGKDKKGRTPLHLATLLQRTDIMHHLATKHPTALAMTDNVRWAIEFFFMNTVIFYIQTWRY